MWGAAHPNHQRILRGLFSVAGLVIVAKLVAAAKEMVVAARYGVSGVVDSYLVAHTISTWLPTILVSAATVVLVPKIVALRQVSNEQTRFVAELNGTTLLLGFLLVALTAGVGAFIVPLMNRGAGTSAHAAISEMVLTLAPLSLLTLVSGLMCIRLQAAERHGFALTEAAPAMGILLVLLLVEPGSGPGPLLIGTLMGALGQVVWSSAMVRRAEGLGGVTLRRLADEWRSIYASLAVMTTGSIVMGLLTPIDQFFAIRLGEGALAALAYANRIIALATGLGAVALARALLPVFSAAAAAGSRSEGLALARRWSWIAFASGTAMSLVGWYLAPWGVAVLFERGAFTNEDTTFVASILRASLAQLPFYFASIVLVQWLAALGRHRFMLYVALVGVAAKAGLNATLSQPFGVAGIAIATSAVYAISFFSQYVFVAYEEDK